MKNTSFQLDIVYSSPKHNLKHGEDYAKTLSFYPNLYNDHPEDCPWPKARLLYQEHIEKYKNVLYAYFVPIKRTACYVTFLVNGKYLQRRRVKYSEAGVEYVIIDKLPLHADDIDKASVVENYGNYTKLNNERSAEYRYICALMHLEEYGYVYLNGGDGKDAIRITTIEELNEAFGK